MASGSSRPIRPGQPLTVGQVARVCRVAPRTAAKWIDSGRLPGYRLPGCRDRRVELSALSEFVAAHGLPMPDELRPFVGGAVVSYGLPEGEPAGVACRACRDPFAFGAAAATAPVGTAVIGDADGLGPLRQAALLVAGLWPDARIVLVLSDDVPTQAVADAPAHRTVYRPVDWAELVARPQPGPA